LKKPEVLSLELW